MQMCVCYEISGRLGLAVMFKFRFVIRLRRRVGSVGVTINSICRTCIVLVTKYVELYNISHICTYA